MGPKFKMGHVT